MSRDRLVEIFTDGACSGNPGPGGWGVVLRCGAAVKEMYGSARDTTNNRMELLAVISGLQALTRPVKVMVYTDSTYVQQGISQWIHSWKRNGWKTKKRRPVKNEDLWRMLDQIALRHDVEWHWVKAHAAHADNERADALARKGAGEAA